MDPDANLEEQRRLVTSIVLAMDSEGGPDTVDLDDVDRLCELVRSLDAWITRGGFLPQAWTKVQP